ncbi:M6 family metalloprotease domain protein [Kribbella flavida DSM 17836]|uniref:M6 family metalloprotease domain protein n=1 Tax=Kribbella flavida (strain DSM 17836 / JCM 10339 / NBRC 14399) TaxID=479435 RepID=D2PZB9_KRIFD|nr:immune inhibitor A domain-containing protein [Kribbella flavida]ADB33728.1 M6 family metalloprotease domain protein [Kribbella flavida DSM 17836]
MRKVSAGLFSLALAATIGLSAASSGSAAPPQQPAVTANDVSQSDELPSPLEDKRRELRQEALTKVLNGSAKAEKRGASTVVKLGKKTATAKGKRVTKAKVDQYVELSREKTDRIFVVLAEFGNERHPSYPDQDTAPNVPGPTTFEGPLHNAIPAPDRSVDNSTVWQADYNRQHYQDMYFGTGNSVKKYYEKQSSGRYSVAGTVTDWVKVQYNEARYGRSNGYPCASNVCNNTWALVRDAVNQWVADQKAAGRTTAQITAELKTFDQWDRYDFDGDGNFNESDGYLDHFQIVHSGGDQADGDPHQGEDAIWSHRWYVGLAGGPANNPAGGAQLGDTGLWVGDYTIQPENGGISVFAHEYGHDLGLPDHYDTSGPPVENHVNWWTLMAQSRVGKPSDGGIGEQAADLGAWDKLQLGWLDYEIVRAGQNKTLELGPHEYNSAKAQGLVVTLPKKPVTRNLQPPAVGTKSWWSGEGDEFTHTMNRQVTLPAGPASLTFQANWDIEDCGTTACDYAYVEVNDGTGYKPIAGSITKAAEGNGIDGKSNGWVPATFDLSAYAGKTIGLQFRYTTDNNTGGFGFHADAIKVTSGTTTVLESGAETSPEGWTLNGFSSVGSTLTTLHDNYYLASHINYISYDKHLRTGPYNFGFGAALPDKVEHFPYQDGLLIWYWDTSQRDNNTNVHPGEGLVLPVDSHPEPINRLDGQIWRPRVAGYDAPFGLEKADSFTLHVNGQPSYIRGQDGVRTFNDSRQYWFPEQPSAGVKVPNNKVNISVLERNGTTMKVRVAARN